VIRAGGTFDGFGSFEDFAPTLLDLAGIKPTAESENGTRTYGLATPATRLIGARAQSLYSLGREQSPYSTASGRA
jgi:hypothetical protein